MFVGCHYIPLSGNNLRIVPFSHMTFLEQLLKVTKGNILNCPKSIHCDDQPRWNYCIKTSPIRRRICTTV